MRITFRPDVYRDGFLPPHQYIGVGVYPQEQEGDRKMCYNTKKVAKLLYNNYFLIFIKYYGCSNMG